MRKRNRSVLGSKKGMIGIVITLTITLLLFGLISLFVYKAFDEINIMIQDDDSLTPNSKAIVGSLHNRYPATLDGAFVVVFALLWILGMVAGYMADNSPLFLIVAIVFILFLLIAAAVFSNVWAEVIAESEVDQFKNSFPYTDFILNHFLLVGLTISASIVIIMYLKGR